MSDTRTPVLIAQVESVRHYAGPEAIPTALDLAIARHMKLVARPIKRTDTTAALRKYAATVADDDTLSDAALVKIATALVDARLAAEREKVMGELLEVAGEAGSLAIWGRFQQAIPTMWFAVVTATQPTFDLLVECSKILPPTYSAEIAFDDDPASGRPEAWRVARGAVNRIHTAISIRKEWRASKFLASPTRDAQDVFSLVKNVQDIDDPRRLGGFGAAITSTLPGGDDRDLVTRPSVEYLLAAARRGAEFWLPDARMQDAAATPAFASQSIGGSAPDNPFGSSGNLTVGRGSGRRG